MPAPTATAALCIVAGPRHNSLPVASDKPTSVSPIGTTTTLPETAGAVATNGEPGASPLRRDIHLTLPVTVSTANKPPWLDELPPRIVEPAMTVGAQSRKPGLT